MDFRIQSKQDMISAVERFGILPLFKNSLQGFSVEEHVDPAVWFTDVPGPWEWKGPVIRETGCAYGKLFEGKAAFVRRDLYCELANHRRDGYDFDARWDDGLAQRREKELYDLVEQHGPVVSRRLKGIGGFGGKDGKTWFEPVMLRLQHSCYVLTSDFVYAQTRLGKPYGWGLAEYATPEQSMGTAFTERVYKHRPEQSRELLLAQLKVLFPFTEDRVLLRFLG